MLVTSRSFAEYRAFLDLDDLPASVVDVSAGASSSTADASAAGVQALAMDPVNRLDQQTLADVVLACARRGDEQVLGEGFTYAWYGSPACRKALRREAAGRFLRDRGAHPGREPAPPTADGWRRRARRVLAPALHLGELARRDLPRGCPAGAAARGPQVRVYPLVRQDGVPVPWLGALLRRLRADGVDARLRGVGYEFQVGARHDLVLRR